MQDDHQKVNTTDQPEETSTAIVEEAGQLEDPAHAE